MVVKCQDQTIEQNYQIEIKRFMVSEKCDRLLSSQSRKFSGGQRQRKYLRGEEESRERGILTTEVGRLHIACPPEKGEATSRWLVLVLFHCCTSRLGYGHNTTPS